MIFPYQGDVNSQEEKNYVPLSEGFERQNLSGHIRYPLYDIEHLPYIV